MTSGSCVNFTDTDRGGTKDSLFNNDMDIGYIIIAF